MKPLTWAILIAIAGLISLSAYVSLSSDEACMTQPAAEMNIGGHANLERHIHANLQIIINGESQFIPGNIGILPNVMRPLHTHGGDGEIHIEAGCPRKFKLKEFFQVWGKRFDSQCIFDKCINDTHQLRMLINGVETTEYENLIMADHDRIEIIYEAK